MFIKDHISYVYKRSYVLGYLKTSFKSYFNQELQEKQEQKLCKRNTKRQEKRKIRKKALLIEVVDHTQCCVIFKNIISTKISITLSLFYLEIR